MNEIPFVAARASIVKTLSLQYGKLTECQLASHWAPRLKIDHSNQGPRRRPVPLKDKTPYAKCQLVSDVHHAPARGTSWPSTQLEVTHSFTVLLGAQSRETLILCPPMNG